MNNILCWSCEIKSSCWQLAHFIGFIINVLFLPWSQYEVQSIKDLLGGRFKRKRVFFLKTEIILSLYVSSVSHRTDVKQSVLFW